MSIKVIGSLIPLVAFFNPTGYSYLHYAMTFPWSTDIESGVMGTVGMLLFMWVAFLLLSAWSSTRILGKFIFFTILVGSTFIASVAGVLDNTDNIIWFSIITIYLFILWGMLYPRITFSMFRQRDVNEVDDI